LSYRTSRLPPWIGNVPVPLLAAVGGLVAGTTFVMLAGQASLLIALGVMAGIIVAGAIFVYPELGYYLTVLTIPIERLGRFSEDRAMATLSLGRFVGIFALGAFLLHALLKRWKLRTGAAVAVYAIYFVYGAITVAFSNDLQDGVRTAGQVASALVFVFLVINVARSWRLAKAGLVLWLVASLATGVWTVLNWHFEVVEGALGGQTVGASADKLSSVLDDRSPWDKLEGAVRRAQGPTSHPAVYGINMVMTLPFWLFLFRVHRSRSLRIAIGLALLVTLYAIFLTNTRAAVAVTLGVFAVAVLRGLVRVTPGGVIALMVAGSLMLFAIPNDVWTRVLDVGRYASGANQGTLELRFRFWNAALTGIGERPWFGHGLGNQLVVPALVRDVEVTRISAHNEFLNTMLEVGLVGWVLMFGAVFLFVRASFQAATLFRQLPGRSEQYWFMIAAQLTLLSALFYGIQVDVFHFPLKGWWLIAALSWSLLLLAQEDTRALATAPPARPPDRGREGG